MLCSLAPWTPSSSIAQERCSGWPCPSCPAACPAPSALPCAQPSARPHDRPFTRCRVSVQTWTPSHPCALWPPPRSKDRAAAAAPAPCGAVSGQQSPAQRLLSSPHWDKPPELGQPQHLPPPGALGDRRDMVRGSRAVLGAPWPCCLHRRRAQPCRRQRAISSEWHGAGREERLIEEETRQMPLVQSDLLIVESRRCGCCQLTCGDTALLQGQGGQRAGRSSPRPWQSCSLRARAHKSCPGRHKTMLGRAAALKAPAHVAPAALAPLLLLRTTRLPAAPRWG